MSPMNKFFMWVAIIGICAILGPVLVAHFVHDIGAWIVEFLHSLRGGVANDPNIKN